MSVPGKNIELLDDKALYALIRGVLASERANSGFTGSRDCKCISV